MLVMVFMFLISFFQIMVLVQTSRIMVKQCGDYVIFYYDVLNHGPGHNFLHLNQTMFNQ
jgi:hypothetical protein